MPHLKRAIGILVVVLLVVLVGLRVIPVPEFLIGYGFHTERPERSQEQWASLPVQYGKSAVCVNCHGKEYSTWQEGSHSGVNCGDCHGPAKSHIDSKGEARPRVDTSRELCGTCHAKLVSRPGDFPQVDMGKHGGEKECVACHNPHDPGAGLPPQVPHTLEGRSNCQSCHGRHQKLKRLPPTIPHTLKGRTKCLSCHRPEEAKRQAPPKIPHTLEGRSDCLVCHKLGGIKPFPKNHVGRTSDTCLNCHERGPGQE